MTRADQWAAAARCVAGIAMVAAITLVAAFEVLRIGPANADLLYLLPVLWVSSRAGLPAGIVTAGCAAFCYNFFLLEPRYTLQIHGLGDISAFVVLTAAAVVTSRLAADLRLREIEAMRRVAASEAEAAFSAILVRAPDRAALDAAALAFLRARYDDVRLIRADDIAAHTTGLAPLDASAAAWALHNDALSGHASEVMPSADYRFVPLVRDGEDVLALAGGREFDARGAIALARLWVQARDRLTAAEARNVRAGAEARETTQRALLAALGHDFRTPLTVLKTGLAEIDDARAVPLRAEVDRIARLSADLIAAARLDSGTTARLEPIDMVDPVATAVPPPRPGLPAVAIDLPDDLPLVEGDATMLAHLIGNLVDNALRHARAQVTIAAHAADGAVVLHVRDDGPGIDPAVADRLFDRFVSGSDRSGGSGLGLAIARDLARAMGATLALADVAEGACFALTLRRADPPIEAEA